MVNGVSAAISSIPAPKPMTVGGDASENVEELRKLTERKQRVAAQARQTEHKLMVAYSAWVRAAGMCQAGLEVALQNVGNGGRGEGAAIGKDSTGKGGMVGRGSLALTSGDVSRNNAAKNAMRKALKECTKEQIKFCLLYTSPSPRDQRGSRMPSSA